MAGQRSFHPPVLFRLEHTEHETTKLTAAFTRFDQDGNCVLDEKEQKETQQKMLCQLVWKTELQNTFISGSQGREKDPKAVIPRSCLVMPTNSSNTQCGALGPPFKNFPWGAETPQLAFG